MGLPAARSRSAQRSRFYVVLGAVLAGFAAYGLYSAQVAEGVEGEDAVRQGVVFGVFGAAYLGALGWCVGWLEGQMLDRGWVGRLRFLQVLGWFGAVVGTLVVFAVIGVFQGIGLMFDRDLFGLQEHQVYLLALLAWTLLGGYVSSVLVLLVPVGMVARTLNRFSGGTPPAVHHERGFRGLMRIMLSHEASVVMAVLGIVEITLGAALGFPAAVGIGLACLGLVLALAAWTQQD